MAEFMHQILVHGETLNFIRFSPTTFLGLGEPPKDSADEHKKYYYFCFFVFGLLIFIDVLVERRKQKLGKPWKTVDPEPGLAFESRCQIHMPHP